jgi:hypothetical protein
VTFFRSILLVAGVAACISFVIFVGHALSTHHVEPVYIGLAALATGAVLLFVYNRSGGSAGAAREPR